MSTGKTLVIVESPAKANKISSYLGPDYIVTSSKGHICDLPTKSAEIPAKYKKESWARTGVNIDDDFAAIYVVPSDKKATIRELKTKLKDADELLLATDEDREGEAIAWHLIRELKPKVPVKRMVFHEITKPAILAALAQTRSMDEDLVDAQETRRILDRLYGYEVSPVLWRKVLPKLSAGRVQSVATRLIVDRERQRRSFISAKYADIVATLVGGLPPEFEAKLVSWAGKIVAQGKDFDETGKLVKSGAVALSFAEAEQLSQDLASAEFEVVSVEAKGYTRKPYAPFRTTTLQQEAGRKLGFTAQRTMSVAQNLYESGFITYMRTDSVTLSESAIVAARAQVKELYGEQYLPEQPRVFSGKVKNAQEAHEAIRPAGESFTLPKDTGLSGEQLKLYELIWKRTIASQMKDCIGETISVRIRAVADGEEAKFAAAGRSITFPGFLKAYVESVDFGASDDETAQLPALQVGQLLEIKKIAAQDHDTRPPARYTEPSLVAKLEELEIGRPSTYASIIRTITSRDYVFKRGAALIPTWLAFAVTNLLEQHFSQLVDYQFTADMEDILDQIAAGKAQRLAVLKEFYFGDKNHEGLQKLVSELGEIDPKAISSFTVAPGVMVRVGRYGTYLETEDGKRANVSPELAPDELTEAKATEILSAPEAEERILGVAATGYQVVAKDGRYGPYVTEVLPEEAPAKTKPRTASLFKSMSLDRITLAEAEQLLSLPRIVGISDGVEITAQNGRFGPYLKKGSESRPLATEAEIFSITLAQAEEIYAQPKARAASSAVLQELGIEEATGKAILLKNGRYGPYVTDGEFNATLRKADSLTEMTLARAVELLVEKRAKGPTKPRGKRTKRA